MRRALASVMENSTDSTRGQPLALRALKRKAELEAALDATPVDHKTARNDLEVVITALGNLLTGDVDHLSEATAAELNRVLEQNKHLAITA